MLGICVLQLMALGVTGVPLTFHYQGHVIVSGVAFEGTGQFKFALLDGAGQGLWRNSGLPGQPTEPPTAVALPMRRGVYQVSLGDTNLANMAPLSAEVFAGDSLKLRVWFNDGTNGFQQLAPDTGISSVAFAVRAGSAERADVADSVTTVPTSALPPAVSLLVALTEKMTFSSTNPDDPGLLAAGMSVFRKLDAAFWLDGPAGAPSARTGHGGVWSGEEFIVWGGNAEGSLLLNSGAMYDPSADSWRSMSTTGAPEARHEHGSVWTGSRMFVWGGFIGNQWISTGGLYDPRIDRWFPLPAGPLLGREEHITLWTGSKVAIWGGLHITGRLGDGALFDPVANQWTSLPTQGAPSARSSAVGVWTGDELIVWGGRESRGEVGDGARLSITNGIPGVWRSLASPGAPTPRQGHTAVWTGDRMLVWGGLAAGVHVDDGASYDPASDRWSPISSLNAPEARTGHNAVWTGNEMIVLGGANSNGELASGHAYDPVADVWRDLPTGALASRVLNDSDIAEPVARTDSQLVWTGEIIIAFGGEAEGRPVGALQRLNPDPPVYLYHKP